MPYSKTQIAEKLTAISMDMWDNSGELKGWIEYMDAPSPKLVEANTRLRESIECLTQAIRELTPKA